MLWYEHPVNQERYKQGLVPINSVWLFGGARSAQIKSMPLADTRIHGDLLALSIAHDWGGWLEALGQLEERVFRPMAQTSGLWTEIVLPGSERYVQIKPWALGRWKNWLPGGRNNWRSWWSPQS